MRRIYEWLKILWGEKINIFIKGATGGWIVSGMFLFGSSLSDKGAFLVAYFIKVVAVGVSGLISGCATVMGNDMYHWTKSKILKRKVKRKQIKNEKTTRIKRAS
jgi:hypothetical protein